MSSREEILNRVDRALQQADPGGQAPSYVPQVDVLKEAPEDSEASQLLVQLQANLTRVDAILMGPSSTSECPELVVQVAREHQIQSSLLSRHPLLDRLGIPAALEKAGVDPVEMGDLGRLKQAGLGVGVSEWAVCSTGTLVLSSRREKIRSASLVPPVSLLLQPMAGLVPDLNTLFSLQAFRDMQGARIFVTGPSRTGDIELSLTKGVHGPGKVYVLLVEDLLLEKPGDQPAGRAMQ